VVLAFALHPSSFVESGIQYQVVRKLAEGAVAEIFLAKTPESSELFVLKVLRSELTSDESIVGRFLDEARLCQSLSHPNIVRYFGAGRLNDGRVYLLTEFLQGEDLSSKIRRTGPLSIEEVVRLVVPVCSALHYVHERGIVHRDLKPDNIFLTTQQDRCVPKLLDFGLALFTGAKSVRTATGVILATPEYTPPECINGKKADARSDVYALGVLMYEALTGSPPFVAGNYTELLLKHLNEPAPPLPEKCVQLSPIIQRCLAKDPDDRFATVEELSRAISQTDCNEPNAHTFVVSGDVKSAYTPTDPLAGSILGSYQLVKLLGQGAMGRVYQARHTKLGRQVALKVLRPEHARNPQLVERFFQEARTVNEINHEHIVEIFDFVEDFDAMGNKRAYFVMELLAGTSLGDLVRRGPLSIGRILSIARQICSALDAAHKVGVVHRDIKPDNIFIIERSGVPLFVKILDFGVAKLVKRIGASPAQETMDGVIIGTPTYMSPEQAAGKQTDHRADVYAVGVVLYEMLSGKPPFDGEGFGQLVVQIVTEAPPALGEKSLGGENIPSDLRSIVMSCLAKEPSKRPSDMGKLAEMLAPLSLNSRQTIELAGPRRGRRRRWQIALAASVVLAGSAAWTFLKPQPLPEPPPPQRMVRTDPATTQQPLPAATPTQVTLRIRSSPAGAKVIREDTSAELGHTPMEIRVNREDREIPISFDLPGHANARQNVALTADANVSVVLREQSAIEHDKPLSKKRRKNRHETKPNKDDVLDPFSG
jgi:serine/threonine-protein kinase